MMKTMDLLERIDEVRANNVTPKKFKDTWGYTLQDHSKRMMDFIHGLESQANKKRTEKASKPDF